MCAFDTEMTLTLVAKEVKATHGGRVSRSSLKQVVVRTFMLLSAVTFFAQCSQRPMWRSVMAEFERKAPDDAAPKGDPRP
jgi:hypothetical protein